MATAIDLTSLPTAPAAPTPSTTTQLLGDITAPPTQIGELDALAARTKARLGPGDLLDEVMQIIDARLGTCDVRIAATAATLGISARTLQRNLDASGTSYRAVLAHTRRRRRAELRAANLRETEVARRLGFCDARAMRRSLDGTE